MSNTVRFLEPGDPDTGYLSNFFRAPFDLDGQRWPTVEHYYQARKLECEGYRTTIREAASPREAKTLGQARVRPLREDWPTQRIKVMIATLSAKFAQNPVLLNRPQSGCISKSSFDQQGENNHVHHPRKSSQPVKSQAISRQLNRRVSG